MTLHKTDAPALRIALFGYGKMGKTIHRLALEQGMSVPVIISPSDPIATHSTVHAELLQNVDVCIDFSVGNAVLNHFQAAIKAKKPLVIGTTNWHHQLTEVVKTMEALKKEEEEEEEVGVIYGANFAIGTQLFYQMVRQAAKRMRYFPQYDVGGMEWHHAEKADSPSGTARELTKILLDELPGKTDATFDKPEDKLPKEKLHFVSLRSGYCPGVHTVLFDGPHDTIELRHTSRSREGLAQGALTAAEWIVSRKGLFTVEEMINQMQGDLSHS